jgi:hypothetical protein
MQITPAQINEKNMKYWTKIDSALRVQLRDRGLTEVVSELLKLEKQEKLLKKMPYEVLLNLAEKMRPLFSKAQAKKGGAAPKKDALTKLMRKIVDAQPKISAALMWRELVKYKGQGVIIGIVSEKIKYISNGRIKFITFAGVRTRLSRRSSSEGHRIYKEP